MPRARSSALKLQPVAHERHRRGVYLPGCTPTRLSQSRLMLCSVRQEVRHISAGRQDPGRQAEIEGTLRCGFFYLRGCGRGCSWPSRFRWSGCLSVASLSPLSAMTHPPAG